MLHIPQSFLNKFSTISVLLRERDYKRNSSVVAFSRIILKHFPHWYNKAA